MLALLLTACANEGSDRPYVDVRQSEPAPDENIDETLPSVVEAERCIVSDRYLAEHKQCESDADCVVLSYRSTCCETSRFVGVASAAREIVQACADSAPPICVCAWNPNRAEDGRSTVDGSNVVARCEEGMCRSHVADRACGTLPPCQPDQLCVQLNHPKGNPDPENSGSSNAYFSYECVANPCSDELTCVCAQSVCDARNDAGRKCEIERSIESDVACVAYRD